MCKVQTDNLINLILVSRGKYGGTARNWGEGIWGGVGTFHSQNNSDNGQFTVISNNSCILF